MQTHLGGFMDHGFTVRAEYIVGITEQMLECGIGPVKRTPAAFDEQCQITWHQCCRERYRVSLVLAFLQEFCVCERQVDDQVPAQSANTPFRAEHDYLHCFPPPSGQDYRGAISPSRSSTGYTPPPSIIARSCSGTGSTASVWPLRGLRTRPRLDFEFSRIAFVEGRGHPGTFPRKNP